MFVKTRRVAMPARENPEQDEKEDTHREHGLIRSGPTNGPDSENTEYLKVISGARAPTGECSEKPDAVPIFKCWVRGKPEGMNVNKIAGTEGKPQKHVDHISEKGYVSDFDFGLAHEPIALKDAMTVPDAKADKLKTIAGLGFQERQTQGRCFVSLVDLCHLKHSERANNLSNYRAVFTE